MKLFTTFVAGSALFASSFAYAGSNHVTCKQINGAHAQKAYDTLAKKVTPDGHLNRDQRDVPYELCQKRPDYKYIRRLYNRGVISKDKVLEIENELKIPKYKRVKNFSLRTRAGLMYQYYRPRVGKLGISEARRGNIAWKAASKPNSTCALSVKLALQGNELFIRELKNGTGGCSS